ncbi:MAG: hypothetical protein AAGB05_17795 [Pseudomonadota bacterium]
MEATDPAPGGNTAAGQLDRPLRYRGLRFPRDAAVLQRDVARQMEASVWQSAYTDAAFALARSDDRAVVLGAGTGHIVAILAGKLGLRHVWLVEPDGVRRAYVARLADANGLARLDLLAPDDIATVAPTLLFADLTAGIPPLVLPDTLRALALMAPAAPQPGDIPFAAIDAAGLGYLPEHSREQALVFARPNMA